MSIENKVSALIESQFPEFALEEGPKLVAFLKAYYEWMETSGQALYEAKKFPENQDIDTTSDKFLEYFKKEILNSIPDDILVNKRFLAKHIKELYLSKGTEQSYRFLFRALFDEEIDVYYPSEYILKTSDGRWSVDKTIRLTSLASSNATLFDGKIVTGQTSGAKARVNGFAFTEEYGVKVTELFLKNIVGEFSDGETVINEDNTNSGVLFNDTGVLKNVVVTKGGVNHRAGDVVNLIAASGSGANGVVSGTTDQSAITFTITNGGSGYTTNASITISGSGEDASFVITSISNTEVVSLNRDFIEPFASIVLNTGPTFVSGGANTSSVSANIATANVSSVLSSVLLFANVTVGTINSISVLNNGFGYSSLPTVTVIEDEVAAQDFVDVSGGFKGENAVITPLHVPGAITRIDINNSGTSYSKFEPLTVVNQSRGGTTNAIASPIISGQVTYPGKYSDTKGFLSWDQRLQDGNFYQEYSYVIRSTQSIAAYKEITKKILHPAGTKQFGEFKIISNVNQVNDIELDLVSSLITVEANINVPEIVATVASQYAPEGITQVYEYETEIVLPVSLASLESETVQYIEGTGTISISNANLISLYSNTVISGYASTLIGALGSPNYLNGNNTIFESELYSGQRIFIVDNTGTNANGLYIVDTVFSNVVTSTTYNYVANTLTNGTFYYADPVYELAWGSVTANATIVIDYGSVALAANVETAYGTV
jgi:hypothetical protein